MFGVVCVLLILVMPSILKIEGHLSVTPPSVGRTRLFVLRVKNRRASPAPCSNSIHGTSNQYQVLDYGHTAYLVPTYRAVLVCPQK